MFGYALIVEDDETAPDMLTLSAGFPADFAEDGVERRMQLTASLNNDPFSEDKELTLSIGSGSTAGALDFTATIDGEAFVPGAPLTLTLPAGDLEIEAELRLTPTPDLIDEGAEETIEILGRVAGLSLKASFTLTIGDDDEAGLVFTDLDGNPVPPAGLRVVEGEATLYRVGLSSQLEFELVGIMLRRHRRGQRVHQIV